jgi:hypothetical protein
MKFTEEKLEKAFTMVNGKLLMVNAIYYGFRLSLTIHN